jgi:hypothetical protein
LRAFTASSSGCTGRTTRRRTSTLDMGTMRRRSNSGHGGLSTVRCRLGHCGSYANGQSFRRELQHNWQRAQALEPLVSIDPLP